ncbi:hypothetical protein [Aneurinibacillus migulanus]|uniref:Uncharacterized protein n=1 Tax=Aneurinibacillus migulanus TaxID=47500 RepID=A0A1G8PIC5_ANEMI|nr:hypothetical protein [Aneurinibacillus migulanus]MED0892863.1 hypothetical protein [Aneurinibacillus migulanus]MED1619109.1 hypothetical protein [Aneurinibacillus migulanus]GED13998.1 hypothetical protein AMI01nite_19890 [Aneurinibacillus migulanus]SDI92254.1 hypothetical protein SAMN04487909_109102 [Aneurinibacillus migulanus]
MTEQEMIAATESFNRSFKGIRLSIALQSDADFHFRYAYKNGMSVHELHEWYRANPY